METKNPQVENQIESQLDNDLTIVELEERFELTAAAAVTERCTISDSSLSV